MRREMTEQIEELRLKGLGYKSIARRLVLIL